MKQLFITLCLIPALLFSSENPQTGTLIVTYQTDHEGERLDRIRFWLKNEQQKQILYPKKSTYVFDPENKTRMVVIEDLSPGDYILEFLVPNLDGKFKDVPNRKIKISKGDVIKIDQKIKMRTQPKAIKHVVKEYTHHPIPTNTKTIFPHSEEKTVLTPVLEPKPKNTIEKFGKLIVSYDSKEDPSLADLIRFRLIDTNGTISIHPKSEVDTEISLNAGKMVMIRDLPIGHYTIEFYVEGLDQKYPETTFDIRKNHTKSIHQSIQLKSQKVPIIKIPPIEATEVADKTPAKKLLQGLMLTTNIPTAIFDIIQSETSHKFTGKGREFVLHDLVPGSYHITYSSTDPFFVPPKSEMITIKKNEFLEKQITFETLGKIKIHTNVPHASVTITSITQKKTAYTKEVVEGEVAIYLPEDKYQVIFKKIQNLKTPEPVDIQILPLQTEEVNIYFLETSIKEI